MVLYGIPNCDTVRRARKWLDSHNVEYRFHDFRKNGLEVSLLKNWADRIDWKILLNRRGTTWRKLPEKTRESINRENAIRIMLDNPSTIKRPVLVKGKKIIVGFNEEEYCTLESS